MEKNGEKGQTEVYVLRNKQDVVVVPVVLGLTSGQIERKHLEIKFLENTFHIYDKQGGLIGIDGNCVYHPDCTWELIIVLNMCKMVCWMTRSIPALHYKKKGLKTFPNYGCFDPLNHHLTF